MKPLRIAHPHLIILSGIPGSGKSTFAEQFAKTFAIPFIDPKKYTRYVSSEKDRMELATVVAEQLIASNQSVMIETTVGTRSERTKLVNLAKKHGYTPMIIWLQVSPSVAKQRSLKSAGERDTDGRYFAHAMQMFSQPHEAERPVVLSGMHTFSTQAQAILKRLSAGSGRPDELQLPKRKKGDNSIRIQ